MTDRSMMKLRVILAVAGFAMLATAVLADFLGLSAAGGVGEGQFLLIVFGILMLMAAIAGRKFPTVWRYVGMLLLLALTGMLVAMLLKELIPAGNGNPTPRGNPQLQPSIIACDSDTLLMHQFIMWTGVPEQGQDSILMRGGGTRVYGALPAAGGLEISQDLPGLIGENPLDRRQPLYNSTQSLILMMLDLRQYPPPDRVVLVAGDMDAIAAFKTGDPRWHLGSASIHRTLGYESCDLSENAHGPDLAEMLVQVQQTNRILLESMGREFGFQAEFVWQLSFTGDTLSRDSLGLFKSMVDSLMTMQTDIRTLH